MGGTGSGNWYRWQKKVTVDDSLSLSIRDFRRRIQPDTAGTIHWTASSGAESSIGYSITWGAGPIVTLNYRWLDSESVRMPIHLQTTPTQFGGERWWFTCPLEPVSKPVLPAVACLNRGDCHELLARNQVLKLLLVIGGIECQRRVGKLYLPPGAKYFGCRSCQRLTYRSCQEAHQAERLFASLIGSP